MGFNPNLSTNQLQLSPSWIHVEVGCTTETPTCNLHEGVPERHAQPHPHGNHVKDAFHKLCFFKRPQIKGRTSLNCKCACIIDAEIWAKKGEKMKTLTKWIPRLHWVVPQLATHPNVPPHRWPCTEPSLRVSNENHRRSGSQKGNRDVHQR